MSSQDNVVCNDFHLPNVRLAGKPGTWDLSCSNGFVRSIKESHGNSVEDTSTCFLIPSLCHPHIHLDKAFLLSHPKYEDLCIQRGDFAEALSLTTEAKSRFEHDDLLERGRALIEESVHFGVTHMRAFVEVDQGVGMKCLDAGLALKEEFKKRCHVQLCVFAQDPIFSYEDGGDAMRRLLEEAIRRKGVEVLGSTPYVEKDGDYVVQLRNIEWTIDAAMKNKLHLDFHIDYNLDRSRECLVPAAIELLHHAKWPSNPKSLDFRTVVFGHATRLTLFKKSEWVDLHQNFEDLPISFIGLPTSDLFMMGRPQDDDGGGERVRGTLQIPQIIEKYGINGAIGINNVGNAFTPHGNCDPLNLASFGVGIYQAGSKADTEILLECVSSRAKLAIGLSASHILEPEVGDPADFVMFQTKPGLRSFRSRKTIHELVYDPSGVGSDRVTIFNGQVIQ